MTNPQYEVDFSAWAEAQADALRRRNTNELDWENLAEEIENLSRSDRREIKSRLARICEHLLKLVYLSDPEPRRVWRLTVIEQRRAIAGLLEESPSLYAYPSTVLAKAYDDAWALVKLMSDDDQDLPEVCPWSVEQILDFNFWPEPK
jgi:hypothetical protein